MKTRLLSVTSLFLASSLLSPAASIPWKAAAPELAKSPPVKLLAIASSMPLWFEPNRGQVAGRTGWVTIALQ